MADNHPFAGLTAQQVEESRAKYGANAMTPPKSRSLWLVYFEKFKDPMILILLVALLLSFGLSSYELLGRGAGAEVFFEPIGILVAILLATSISFFFEQRAEREFKVLNQVSDTAFYKVMRDGAIHQVAKEDIVKGDVVHLETGEEVPADGVLLESLLLQVNESSLTGEPMARKDADPAHNDPEATYPSNRVYRGTVVIGGHCIMQVEAVGDATEAGAVYQGVQMEQDVTTPLNLQLTRLARVISYGGYVLAGLVILVRMWSYFHYNGMESIDWVALGGYTLNTLMLAVTLLVVAVPEGLPMSISLSLAYSMRSMMKTNNLVRKMHACETLGATTVICTDKTGTLTQNQMRVHALILPDGKEGEPTAELLKGLTQSIAANTTAHLEADSQGKLQVLGNPTEGALLLWLQSQGVNYLTEREALHITNQLPFATERKYMATEVTEEMGGVRYFHLKGAPEYVKAFCSHALTSEGLVPLDAVWKGLQQKLQGYQAKGMRTLAIAHRRVEDGALPFVEEERLSVDGFTLLALVAIIDPVRADVPDAIRECLSAGVKVKIVTGDTLLTAREIARQIALWDPALCQDSRNAISGPEFAELTDAEASDRLSTLLVMYRARPMDKARLIKLLQERGEVVAVTGDGTNDAPALRAAHVGLSMGDGTAVAKAASDMTILDSSFVSIGKGIMWGRSLYLNIQRFIIFQLTINVAACMLVLVGSLFGGQSPLTITQMLWINLIMDTFAALALASLPPNPLVMKDRPREQDDFIINRPMAVTILGSGLVMVFALFTLLEFFDWIDLPQTYSSLSSLLASPPQWDHLRENGISLYEGSLFFSLFVFIQLWNLFNAKAYRTGRSAFHGLWSGQYNRFLLVLGLVFIGQLLLMNFGGRMFSLTPLRWQDQLLVVILPSLVLWIGEVGRLLMRSIR